MNQAKIIDKITALSKGRQLVLATIVAVVSATSAAFAFTAGSGVIIRNDFVRAGFVDPTDLKFKVTGNWAKRLSMSRTHAKRSSSKSSLHPAGIRAGTATPDQCSC